MLFALLTLVLLFFIWLKSLSLYTLHDKYIEVPNFDSIQHKINKNNWIHLDCPRHLTHFTKKGLINFFDNNKFSGLISR